MLTAALVRDEQGQPQYFVSQIEDISERKERDVVLSAAIREKETLLKEVYHRVKNNLQVITSLLNMQVRTLPEGEARTVLKDSADRVRAMSLVHEKLYQSGNLSSIDLRAYIVDLCQRLATTTGAMDRGISVKCDVRRVEVNLDTAIPLSLLLNELISNSMKHGFPEGRTGEVQVTLTCDDDGMATLIVRDNGVGVPTDFDPVSSSSLGLKLVSTLAGQLNGTLKFESRDGLSMSVRFPLPKGA
jgi:two-component sensor histidine kinase